MHNSHRRSIETFSPVSRLGTRSCTTDPDPAIPSAVALGQKGRTSFYGFSDGLTLRQVGTRVPLSPSLGLSQRAETTLLNKFVEISTTTGRFCSRCHVCVWLSASFCLFPSGDCNIAQSPPFFPEKKLRTAEYMRNVFAVLMTILSDPESHVVINPRLAGSYQSLTAPALELLCLKRRFSANAACKQELACLTYHIKWNMDFAPV